MTQFAREVLSVNLEDEMKQSYLDYAMSVIVGRALPDVRDGLKPVHRRVLYAMKELGNEWNKPYKKSARVVGDVIGKFHPHGESAVYDTIVRMAQPFSMRYLLVDGQGNFGSVDGDPPAAMRYTEVRLAKMAHQLLADIDKQTVNFVPNYDESEREPTVLPTRIPNLIVNGSTGIAVGMATNIPPHNLGEVIDACVELIANPDMSLAQIIEKIPGPDFPTAASINGAMGIHEAYASGRGRILLRATAHIEEKNGRESIVVTELPYQVNKARLLEKIAELVHDKRITGISELRDESDKDGMRMVVDLKRGEPSDVVLNNLYKFTAMETVFGINMVALVDGRPQLLGLKSILEAFLRHRREVVTRRTIFDLQRARERAHVLEGQAVALTNIDEVITLIKAARSPADAKQALVSRIWGPGVVTEMLRRSKTEDTTRPRDIDGNWGLSNEGYRLSGVQAQAILDLRLHRLTALEQEKIVVEYKQIVIDIQELLEILSNPDRLAQVIREELLQIRQEFAEPRRTQIVATQSDLMIEDLIPDEEVLVTLSHAGYAKLQPIDTYQAQRRGGLGKMATQTKEEDFIEKMFTARTHDTLLCFSSRGKVFWLKVYELPRAGRGARGKPMINLLPLSDGERISAVLPIREYEANKFVLMATSHGVVKKTPLEAFSRPRTNGIIAVGLREDDSLVDVWVTDGAHDVMLFGSHGKAIRFDEDDVRTMGRTAAGVRGIKLPSGHRVIAVITMPKLLADSDKAPHVLTATENGYGKRTRVAEFSRQGRGGQGVIAIQTSERNGKVVGAILVNEEDEVMLITAHGTLVRTPVAGISVVGRNTQGVRLIRLHNDDRVVGVDWIAAAVNGEQ